MAFRRQQRFAYCIKQRFAFHWQIPPNQFQGDSTASDEIPSISKESRGCFSLLRPWNRESTKVWPEISPAFGCTSCHFLIENRLKCTAYLKSLSPLQLTIKNMRKAIDSVRHLGTTESWRLFPFHRIWRPVEASSFTFYHFVSLLVSIRHRNLVKWGGNCSSRKPTRVSRSEISVNQSRSLFTWPSQRNLFWSTSHCSFQPLEKNQHEIIYSSSVCH